MSYHDLSECTLSADERREEANAILEMFGIGALDTNDCSQVEKRFIFDIADGRAISVKQLFWLRDIKDRIL